MSNISKNRILTLRQKSPKGFTLTELSIVLGIMGIIMATIWGVASSTFENNGVTSIMQQIVKSVDNIRDTFSAMKAWPTSGTCSSAGINTWPATSNSDVTKCFDEKNLFPTDMRIVPSSPGNTAINHALGGSFLVLDESNAAITSGDNGIRIKLLGLKSTACIKLLQQLPLSDASIGITNINVIGTGANCMKGISGGLSCSTAYSQMTSTAAQSWCNGASNTNEIDVDFKLHN